MWALTRNENIFYGHAYLTLGWPITQIYTNPYCVWCNTQMAKCNQLKTVGFFQPNYSKFSHIFDILTGFSSCKLTRELRGWQVCLLTVSSSVRVAYSRSNPKLKWIHSVHPKLLLNPRTHNIPLIWLCCTLCMYVESTLWMQQEEYANIEKRSAPYSFVRYLSGVNGVIGLTLESSIMFYNVLEMTTKDGSNICWLSLNRKSLHTEPVAMVASVKRKWIWHYIHWFLILALIFILLWKYVQ